MNGARRRLPTDRSSITHRFRVGEAKGYLIVGMYEDGTPGEMFITISKEGSTIEGLIDAVAIMTSVALQYGVPLADIVRKMIHTNFEPAGPTGNKSIPFASSVLDYVFRWMALKFLKREEEDNESYTEPAGQVCPECGSLLKFEEGCLSCSARCGYTRC